MLKKVIRLSASRALLMLFAIVCFSFIEKQKDNPTDKYVATIDKNLQEKKLAKKKLENMSRLGGSVTGYYLSNKLVLIKTCNQGHIGFHRLDFYIQNDSLVLVKEIAQTVKLNDKLNDSKIVYGKDKNGDADLSKYPLTENNKNTYYISDTMIVDFRLKSFGKTPKIIYEDVIAEKNKEIIQHYRAHLKELKE
jgi:hypothetical protein